MKKYLLILLLFRFYVVDLYAQKGEKDYEILNKLFPEVIRDSSKSFFDCEFIIEDEDLTNSLYDHLNEMTDSLAISSEFKQYSRKSLAKKIKQGTWNKDRISYPTITKGKENRRVFSISPIIYSKSKRYFFVVVDHYQTHMACAIFEIRQDASIKVLNHEGLLIRTPVFR